MRKSDLDLQAKQMLKAAKLYCTKCRVAVVTVLLKSRSPKTCQQIAKCLSNMRFNKVSIYRTLASLLEVGLVHRAFMQERAWYFELAKDCSESQCHPHFTCTNCGDTHCLTEMALPMAKSPHNGFVIRRQQVRLEGLCPKCA